MYRLKNLTFLLFIVTANAALTPADLIRAATVRRQCDNTNRVDPNVIARVRQGEMVNDRNFDCYVSCILQGTNLMGPDGSLNIAVARDKLPQNSPLRDPLMNAINACGNQRGSDPCDTAHMLFVCFHQQNIPSLLLAQAG